MNKLKLKALETQIDMQNRIWNTSSMLTMLWGDITFLGKKFT
jgi:hypothetical protein